MFKKRCAKWFIGFTDSWNYEFHQEIEARVDAEYTWRLKQRLNPEKVSLDEMAASKKEMREFYYARMSNTASLIVSAASCVIAVVALLVALASLLVSMRTGQADSSSTTFLALHACS